MKVAIVHDWLTGMRGGERVLEAFLRLYPKADIYTLFHIPGTTSKLIDSRVKQVSWLQKFPGIKRVYRFCLPLYPFAISSFNFDAYDLVISTSHAAAKNITVPKETIHISYCFSPMRYIWDQARQYFGALVYPLWPILMVLRVWDRRGGRRATCLVGISKFIAARIRCFYQVRAKVIYPPVDTSWIKPRKENEPGKAFLYAGALVPYKRVDLAIEACTKLGLPLWVVGTGPDENDLKKRAGSNVKFLGRVSDEDLAQLYKDCRALIFPGTEDFGLIPIECLAAGRPVIALDSGALKETLTGIKPWDLKDLALESPTGVFIKNKTKDPLTALVNSLKWFVDHETLFTSEACQARAKLFATQRFVSEWSELISEFDFVNSNEATNFINEVVNNA